ncbi:MAG: DUF3859 domain-containing protein [Mycobacteriaceae bacterium]|nr:DUF3859 domain-containing protein [Mycobacteriaceae bacterium]
MIRVLIVLLFLSASAMAQPETDILGGQGAKVLEIGTFRLGQPRGREQAPGMLEGSIRHHRNSKLVQATHRICARLGETFGIRYVADPPVTGPPPIVEVVYTHPNLTARNGRQGALERWWTTLQNRSKTALVTLHDSYQLVPGPWTISIHHGDTVLARVTFDVETDCGTPIS